MGVAIPELTPEAFAGQLAVFAPEPLTPQASDALFAHFQELRRWAPRLSLIGPGTAGEVVRRHFGESLAALPFLPTAAARLVDLGSGAGFPGLVLAACRPGWGTTLVEAQERKWAFLQTAARRAGLAVHCLNARVSTLLPPGLPEAYEVLTVRALKLPMPVLDAATARLTAGGRVLLWASAGGLTPAGWRVATESPLPGAEARRLLVLERA